MNPRKLPFILSIAILPLALVLALQWSLLGGSTHSQPEATISSHQPVTASKDAIAASDLSISESNAPYTYEDSSTSAKTIQVARTDSAEEIRASLATPPDFSTNIPPVLLNVSIGKKVFLEDFPGEPVVMLEPDDMDRLAPHLGILVTSAAPVLAYRDGVLVGIELGRVGEESILSGFGFKEGDIISRVNGVKINDPFEVIQVLRSLEGNLVEFTIDRDGPQHVRFLLPHG